VGPPEPHEDEGQPPTTQLKADELLVDFVRRRLLLADDHATRSPYRNQEELAARVAVAVAARAYPTFLVAQLTSRALVQADDVVDVEARDWEQAFPHSVADAMDGYLDRLAEEGANEQERRARKRRVRELLTRSPMPGVSGCPAPCGQLLQAPWPTAPTTRGRGLAAGHGS
jgi:hypothetical protein